MDSRVAVVTGGGSGIGLAVARALLADGPVVVVDRDAEAIKAVSSEGLDALCLDVTVTDDWRAIVGQDAAAAYVASKGAVVAVTRALATELAAHGVRVNSVCPGSTMTPLLERHFASIPDGEEAHRRLVARHPIGRLLTPADVEPTIVHLTRPEAGAITGSNIVVDGGLTATFDYGT